MTADAAGEQSSEPIRVGDLECARKGGVGAAAALANGDQLAFLVAARQAGAAQGDQATVEQGAAAGGEPLVEPVSVDILALQVVAGTARARLVHGGEKGIALARAGAVAVAVLAHGRAHAHLEAKALSRRERLRHALDRESLET